MTDFQKSIYNTYLRVSRSIKSQPFRYRQDFSNFEDDKNYVYVLKLTSFFTAHPQVNIDLFFKAPYEIYGKTETFYLDFYLSPKSFKAYTLYLDQVKNADPDSPDQLQYIINSAKFIRDFCMETKLNTKNYLDHQPESTPSWLLHLMQCKVSVYMLFAFESFDTRFRSFDTEIIKFLLGDDFFDKFHTYRLNHISSKKAKFLALKSLEKISQISA